MKSKKQEHMIEQLVKPVLVNMIDLKHPLVELADSIDWEKLEEIFGKLYHENQGRPGIKIRLMIGLHYLKYTYNMSDREVLYRWLENPYWQYFARIALFGHPYRYHSDTLDTNFKTPSMQN
ncbi:transposase [Deferribacter autotrophicus]|uniref:Transposase n=1 Tax=Deferribacter autotrophicus TaxID=500465 RepID=A0A5A8EYX5_9BACT|nr:transposase [Deferribacter autotrophicus]KAA0256861.1 transposase [Deferribacter autotrophicus]